MHVSHISRCKTLNSPRYNIFGGFVYVPFTHAYIEDDVIFVSCDSVLYKTESITKQLEIGE